MRSRMVRRIEAKPWRAARNDDFYEGDAARTPSVYGSRLHIPDAHPEKGLTVTSAAEADGLIEVLQVYAKAMLEESQRAKRKGVSR